MLSLALPEVDEGWLEGFSAGLLSLADAHDVALVGGDTTRGPLNLSIQIIGEVTADKALRRDQALPGDDIWISGIVGEAALGLRHLQQQLHLPAALSTLALQRLHAPQPRVNLCMALAPYSRCAIDISDGLVADLSHICEQSGCGAQLSLAALPQSPLLQSVDADLRQQVMLAGGDDYELCFTAKAEHAAHIGLLSRHLALPLTRIGTIVAGSGVQLQQADGSLLQRSFKGFDHFA